MTNNLDDFKRELGQELVAAATRRLPAGKRRQRPFGLAMRPLAAVAGFVVVAMTAVIAIGLARPEPASAQVFEITRTDGNIVIAVVDIVDDPQEAITQLQLEANIDAEIFALPVPTELVGQIIGIGSSGDIAADTERTADGTISKIVVPENFDGALLIEYGRPAEPDEFYAGSLPDTVCAELWSKTPGETIDRIQEISSVQRFEAVDERNVTNTNVSFESIDPTYRLTRISFLSRDVVIVTYAANVDRQPRHRNCQ